MTLVFNTSLRTLAATAALLLAAVAPWAQAAPQPASDLAATPVELQGLPSASRVTCLTPSAALQQETLHGTASGSATETPAAEQLALGQTHCWWACYPGSGCEHICQYYPQ